MIKKHIRSNTLHGSLMRLNKAHRKMAGHKFKEVNLTEGKPKLLDFLVNNSGCSQLQVYYLVWKRKSLSIEKEIQMINVF